MLFSYWLFLPLILIPLPFVYNIATNRKTNWVEIGITVGVSIAIASLFFLIGSAGQTDDREIWNGEITEKNRVHGSYSRPYDCFCYTTCSGTSPNQTCSQHCQTCWESRYTVNWSVKSNLREFRIASIDRSSKSAYNEPDPAAYTRINIGDPCSITVPFTNYVKAVPESIFTMRGITQLDEVPAYPLKIYDEFKIDRVIPVGVTIDDLPAWNQDLSMILRKLGPQKQANAIIVVTNKSPSFAKAIEYKWLSGKKNDVILVIGTSGKEIDWTHVISWTKNTNFKTDLESRVHKIRTLDRPQIMQALHDEIKNGFQRRQMSEFKHLEEKIEPPKWVIIASMITGILISLGLSFAFHRKVWG